MTSARPRLRTVFVIVTLCLAALAVILCSASPVRAATFDSFSLAPTIMAASNDYPPEQLMAAARIEIDAIGHVSCEKSLTFDYVRYDAIDTAHTHPLHTTGQGSVLFAGSYDPYSYRLQGRYHLEYTTETTGGWMGPERRTDTYEGTFDAVITGPNTQVPVTVQMKWNSQTYTMQGGQWKPLGSGQANWTKTYNYRQVGGPTPAAPMATVTYAGVAWVRWPGTEGDDMLQDGDVLRPGCRIWVPTPEEHNLGGGQGAPQGGYRLILTFGKGFRYVVEPNSRVVVYDWGVQVESGSVEVEDSSYAPGRADAGMGFCSGKDPGGAQVPLIEDQAGPFPVPVRPTAAVAAGDVNRYRVEVTSDSMRVSVYTGRVYVTSTATEATLALTGGQSVVADHAGFGPVSTKSFLDVAASSPYHTAIIGMALKGIVDGYPSGVSWEFRPLDSVKRAQFTKMIDGVLGLTVTEDVLIPFNDLGADALDNLYPHEYVAVAAAAGITTGVRPGAFAPYDAIKRAQVVTMIVRGANKIWPDLLQTPPSGWTGELSSFTDATHGASMRIAEFNGLLDGLFGFGKGWDPWRLATRGEVAQMLWNLMMR